MSSLIAARIFAFTCTCFSVGGSPRTFWSHFLETWTANQWISLQVTYRSLGFIHYTLAHYPFSVLDTPWSCASEHHLNQFIERFQDVSRHRELQRHLFW